MRVLQSLAAVAALTLTASAAMAQLTVPAQPAAPPTPLPGTGNSGIIVAAWDSKLGVSLVQYLGLTLDQFVAGGTPEAGFSPPLDFGKLSGWDSVFAGSSATDIQYEVVGADSVADAGGFLYQGKRLLTTLGATPASGINNVALNGAVTAVNNFFPVCSATNPCLDTTGSGAGNYAGKAQFGNRYNSQLPVTAAASVDTGLKFFLVSGANVSSGDPFDEDGQSQTTILALHNSNASNIGTWLLTSGGDLTYSLAPVSAVPLPAAVWLLLSGLAGVGVVGRRRAA
jgi:hypothetical protein